MKSAIVDYGAREWSWWFWASVRITAWALARAINTHKFKSPTALPFCVLYFMQQLHKKQNTKLLLILRKRLFPKRPHSTFSNFSWERKNRVHTDWGDRIKCDAVSAERNVCVDLSRWKKVAICICEGGVRLPRQVLWKEATLEYQTKVNSIWLQYAVQAVYSESII